MTLHTLFPLALVCHCCSTSIPLFRSHSTLLRSFSPRHGLRYCSAQASTKATPAPQDDRRARIRARTATVDDYQAEIAAQERELAAAVVERKQIDSKLEAAETRQAKYEKELKKCETALAAKQPGVDIADLRSEKERLKASIAVESEKARQYLEERGLLVTRIKELHADIAELKQHLGAWHDLTYAQFAIALVMSFSLPPPSFLSFFFPGLLSSRVLTTAVQFKPCFNFVRLLVLVLLVLVLLCFRFAPHNTYHITHAPFLPTGLLTEWRDIDNTSLTRDLIPGVSLLSSLARISCMFVPLLCSSVCCSSDFTLVPPMLSAADGWHHHAVRPTKSV